MDFTGHVIIPPSPRFVLESRTALFYLLSHSPKSLRSFVLEDVPVPALLRRSVCLQIRVGVNEWALHASTARLPIEVEVGPSCAEAVENGQKTNN